jgi:hypothetical protein
MVHGQGADSIAWLDTETLHGSRDLTGTLGRRSPG